MWNVEQDLQNRLLAVTGHSSLDPSGFPESIVEIIFAQPLELMRGRAESYGSDEQNSSRLQPRIKVAINDAPTVNAYAIPGGAYSIVSINTGTCIRLPQLMQHAVYNEEVFFKRETEHPLQPKLIADSLALTPAASILEPVDLTRDLRENSLAIAAPVAPTVERHLLSRALTVAALDFLIMHEIAHIGRDQMRFYPTYYGKFFLEADIPGSEHINNSDMLLSQLLELDADLGAARTAIRHHFHRDGSIASIWDDWTDNKIEILYLLLVSLALAFFLLDSWSRKSGGPSGSHPLPRVRLVMILASIADEIMGLELASDLDEAISIVMGAQILAASVWRGLGLPEESTTIGNAEQVNAEMNYYSDKLVEYGILPRRE